MIDDMQLAGFAERTFDLEPMVVSAECGSTMRDAAKLSSTRSCG
jgi:hypothetical protein